MPRGGEGKARVDSERADVDEEKAGVDEEKGDGDEDKDSGDLIGGGRDEKKGEVDEGKGDGNEDKVRGDLFVVDGDEDMVGADRIFVDGDEAKGDGALFAGGAAPGKGGKYLKRLGPLPIWARLAPDDWLSMSGSPRRASSSERRGPCARGRGAFVALNCAAISASLLESELFGHAPGAFTGASRTGADGKIGAAHGGTLFLDEIVEMPEPLQAALLRVLDDGTYHRVGDGRATALAGSGPIAREHFPELLVSDAHLANFDEGCPRTPGERTKDEALRAEYAATIRACSGNVAEAARRLGVARSMLYRTLKR